MASKTDLMYEILYNPDFAPQRSLKVNIKTLVVDGKKTYVMKNHLTGSYYDIDDVSYDIWNLLDGQRTVSEISEETLRRWPKIEPETAEEVLFFLAEAGCLKAIVEEAPKKRIRIPSSFEVDVVLIRKSQAFLEKIHRASHFLLKTPLFWGSIAFIVLCSILFAGQFAAIFAEADNFEILGSTIVGFFFYSFVVLGPVIAIHEIAHGLALVHYGGVPGEIGTGLFYFSPMFYIDSTDAWTLSRRQRIMVMMGGNISTLFIASAIVAIGYIFPYPASISHVLYMTAFFCFYVTLMNLAPPFETDGYYVLADLVNIPNLRQESYGYVKSLFKKALGKHVKMENFDARKKRILIGFAILSVAWIVYTAFQTTLFTYYMLGDARDSFFTVYSAIVSPVELSVTALIVSVASVLYFGMTMAGYGIIFTTAIKKALRVPLKFEAIHDRDLSTFFYLPSQARSIEREFEEELRRIAGKITQNHTVQQVGSTFTATLRMGGTELALNQIGPHLRKIEQSFSSMYQDFLEENAEDLFHPADIYGSTIVRLETLLREMGHEIAEAGMPEAKNVVQEIVEKQNRISRYLLNSTYGSVWTIELPPFLLYEVEETLLPTFFVEDFAITDLYGEAEEFKKCTIYGLDSLSKLSAQNRAYLQEVLKNPEEHQLVTCFEPIKSRLLFAGRSEQIEKDIPRFSTLFVNQAWSGYLDNLLGETNLTLSTLRHPPTLDPGDLETMKDGELFVLNKNLSMLSTCEKTVKRALDESDQFVEQMKQDIDGLKRYFEENKSYEIGLFNALFAINKENLGRLPRRLTKFRREFQRITVSVGKVIDRVQKEYHKKKPDVRKKRRRILYISPVVALLSVILVLTNLYLPKGILATSCLAAAAVIPVIYWVFYYLRLRRLQNAGRYPSRSFVEQQLFVLAFAQALYKFIAAYNVIGPVKEDNSQILQKKEERKNRG